MNTKMNVSYVLIFSPYLTENSVWCFLFRKSTQVVYREKFGHHLYRQFPYTPQYFAEAFYKSKFFFFIIRNTKILCGVFGAKSRVHTLTISFKAFKVRVVLSMICS